MTERNRAIVERLADGFWNKKDVKVFDEAFAGGVVDNTAMPGSEGTE